jgi:hypothetical protein
MRKLILFTVLFFYWSSVISQEFYHPDSILINKKELPKVLLVGAFHFAYYNLDAHKTDVDKQVDVLSEKRQKEMNELLNYIALFKPTKIAVEANENTSEFMKRYSLYLKNSSNLGRDEREQIGFPLMKQFQLDTLYGVDANGLADEMLNSEDSSIQNLSNKIFEDYDFQSNDKLSQKYIEYYKLEDSLKLVTTLLQYFKHSNSSSHLKPGFGSYLVGDFKLGDQRGADALALYWYNRNLRIFRNLQKITTSSDDRILVIFGSGHVQILKQLFESSPEYELIDFNSLD